MPSDAISYSFMLVFSYSQSVGKVAKVLQNNEPTSLTLSQRIIKQFQLYSNVASLSATWRIKQKKKQMNSFKKCSKNNVFISPDTSPIALYRIYHSTNTNIFSHTNTFDCIYFILCAREYIYHVHLAFTQLTFVHNIVCMNITIMIIIEPPFDEKWWVKYYIINTTVGFVHNIPPGFLESHPVSAFM